MISKQNGKGPQRRVYLFIDTNVFIHFTMYDSVDWLAITGADEVILVMDGIVLEELDRYKDDRTNPGRRDRVRDVLAKFQKLGEVGSQVDPTVIKNGVSIFPLIRSPKPDWTERGLDPLRADDRLIGSMLQFSEENAGIEIAFITNDTTPRLKAKKFNIGVISPIGLIDAVELSSEQEKELKRLREQVALHETRSPKVDVRLVDGDKLANHLKIALVDPQGINDLSTEELDKEVESIRRDYMRAINLHYKQMPHYYRDFLEDLSQYLDKYREYRWRTWLVESAIRIDLEFCVENLGSAMANDVEVDLHFPDSVAIVDSEEVPSWLSAPDELEEPDRPKIPAPPTGFAQAWGIPEQGLLRSPLYPGLSNVGSISVPSSSQNVYPMAWTEDDQVRINIPTLKSKRNWLTPTFSIYLRPQRIGGLKIPYTIHCNEMREEISGNMNLSFDWVPKTGR